MIPAISLPCDTCGRRAGAPCDESRVPTSFDGFHSARVRLASGERRARPERRDTELDDYNRAVRARERRR